MARIVITIEDRAADATHVSVSSDPPLDTSNPDVVLTGAQAVAITMLQAAVRYNPVTEDYGLLELTGPVDKSGRN